MVEEYSVDRCPHNRTGLTSDDFNDPSRRCVLTGRPDADHRGWGYDGCDFAGDDYRECSKYKAKVEIDTGLKQQEFNFYNSS